ncbi:hypothetical protein AB5I41_14200 [Sphingomonas sp. MMS24-JH45]
MRSYVADNFDLDQSPARAQDAIRLLPHPLRADARSGAASVGGGGFDILEN